MRLTKKNDTKFIAAFFSSLKVSFVVSAKEFESVRSKQPLNSKPWNKVLTFIRKEDAGLFTGIKAVKVTCGTISNEEYVAVFSDSDLIPADKGIYQASITTMNSYRSLANAVSFIRKVLIHRNECAKERSVSKKIYLARIARMNEVASYRKTLYAKIKHFSMISNNQKILSDHEKRIISITIGSASKEMFENKLAFNAMGYLKLLYIRLNSVKAIIKHGLVGYNQCDMKFSLP